MKNKNDFSVDGSKCEGVKEFELERKDEIGLMMLMNEAKVFKKHRIECFKLAKKKNIIVWEQIKVGR